MTWYKNEWEYLDMQGFSIDLRYFVNPFDILLNLNEFNLNFTAELHAFTQ